MSNNFLECAMLIEAHRLTLDQLNGRIPIIPAIDYRRLAYCLIRDRIDLYRTHGIKRTLNDVLSEFSVTTTAYYAWHEKYHSFYQAM